MTTTTTTNARTGLVVDEISKGFGKGDKRVSVLDRISLEIADGEFVAVVGPSGSGKRSGRAHV